LFEPLSLDVELRQDSVGILLRDAIQSRNGIRKLLGIALGKTFNDFSAGFAAKRDQQDGGLLESRESLRVGY
jgi:hypothetical protein